MRALIKFHKGMLGLPTGVQLWLLLLMALNLFVPFFLLGRPEARWVVATFFASFALMILLTAAAGFTRLLGVGHILWLPLIAFLWGRLGDYPGGELYGLWLRALIIMNTVSLALDAMDVVRYLAGEREEMVDGLVVG